jgi:hypothetical protein
MAGAFPVGSEEERVYCTCTVCIKLPESRLVSKSTKSRHVAQHGEAPLEECLALCGGADAEPNSHHVEPIQDCFVLAEESLSEQTPFERPLSDCNDAADNRHEGNDSMEMDGTAAESDQWQANFEGASHSDELEAEVGQETGPVQDAEDEVFDDIHAFNNEQSNMDGEDDEKGGLEWNGCAGLCLNQD